MPNTCFTVPAKVTRKGITITLPPDAVKVVNNKVYCAHFDGSLQVSGVQPKLFIPAAILDTASFIPHPE